jgi:hypothetical protein
MLAGRILPQSGFEAQGLAHAFAVPAMAACMLVSGRAYQPLNITVPTVPVLLVVALTNFTY